MSESKSGAEAEVIHYGPVWSKPRKRGDSLAACDTANGQGHATLTTHLPWVTCPECLGIRIAGRRVELRT